MLFRAIVIWVWSASESEVAQSCPILCDSMDCSLPGSSVHGIFQARVLEWVTISFSGGSFQPRDWARVSCKTGRHFITREDLLSHKGRPWSENNWLLRFPGSNGGWDGWIASPLQWTWGLWAISGKEWRTGKHGVLQSMGSQRAGHILATKQNQQDSFQS